MARLVVDQWLLERRPAPDLALGDRDAGELAERVAAHPDDRGRAQELESAVRRLTAGARPVDDVALEVAARLNQPRAASVLGLSGATGLSERQIHRRCMAAFGYGPAVLARILRLRRALQLARSHEGPLRLAELAATAGYFDQPHLAHEVRAIMGTTPTRLLRSLTSDPYKTWPAWAGNDPAGVVGRESAWACRPRISSERRSKPDVEGRAGLVELRCGRRHPSEGVLRHDPGA